MAVSLGTWWLFIIYCVFVLIWNKRWHFLYVHRISRPWKAAIGRHDWNACQRWEKEANDFFLDRASCVLNPVAWIRYWNWKPKETNEIEQLERMIH